MKITRVEYSNFRNFKDPGAIDCSTDGKVTIIYGVNGSGKTTFHQLFQWIIYGRTQFNKTASDKMYNLQFEYDAPVNQEFIVSGTIYFEHQNEKYKMHREWKYYKSVSETRFINESFNIFKKTEMLDWKKLERPKDIIEDILPSGLAEYFFFDGEGMITDLKSKGADSAASLKKALYMMLDLSVYDKAVAYIGDTERSTTVLGSLQNSKTMDSNGSAELKSLGIQMDGAQQNRDNLEETKNNYLTKIAENNDRIKEISEKIGANGFTQKEYNSKRENLKQNRDSLLKLANGCYEKFGDELISSFPKLLMSKAIDRASKKIKLQAAESKLLKGVNKELIDSLIATDTCICGNPLTEKEKNTLRELYKYLPPLGYDSLYRNFTDTARIWGKEYNREKIESIISDATEYLEQAQKIDQDIYKLDEDMKSNKKIEDLIVERKDKERENEEYNSELQKTEGNLTKANLLVTKLKKKIDELSSAQESNELINQKIAIMESVKKYFVDILAEKSIDYSKKLEKTIQELLDKMLQAKRNVTVSNDFLLKVSDSYDDESKSEGQFATVSFAYIGGIFKLLKDEQILSNKEYPLVLDAPFSKLGDEPRQKVAAVIPEYAPQIILFSKDNLQGVFTDDQIGHVYTIQSNSEQNVSEVKEGFLWK